MRRLDRRAFLAVLLLLSSLSSLTLRAQTADPSGRWEGAITAQGNQIAVQVDLAKNAKGELIGAFGNPAQHIDGLPLANVGVEGRNVHFELKASSGGGTFRGAIGADGRSMAGNFVTTEGNYSFPFSLTRTGEPKIAPIPTSAAIGKEMEGAWTGTLDMNGQSRSITLKLTNHPDGTSTGTIGFAGEGAEIPISTITQKATSLTLDVKIVGGSYSATLNAQGELVGTWMPGATPLTFKRASPP